MIPKKSAAKKPTAPAPQQAPQAEPGEKTNPRVKIEKHAKALLKAINKALKEGPQPSSQQTDEQIKKAKQESAQKLLLEIAPDLLEITGQDHLSEALKENRKQIKNTARVFKNILDFAPPPEPPPAPASEIDVAPFTPLPPAQFPSTWELAQIAALIGQSQPDRLTDLIHSLPENPEHVLNEASWQQAWHNANGLTHAAFMLWRSAHDMRQVWQDRPDFQENYEAVNLWRSTPPYAEQNEKQNNVRRILIVFLTPKPSEDKSRFDEQTERYWTGQDEKGQPQVNKDRFAEYWTDRDSVTWNEAAILFFRNDVTPEEQAIPGQATPTQNEKFAEFVREFLLKDSPPETDTDYFINTWRNQTTPLDSTSPDTPEFLKGIPILDQTGRLYQGNFTVLWHDLILYIEGRKKDQKSKEGKIYADKRWGKTQGTDGS